MPGPAAAGWPLPDDHPYLTNLAALWALAPALAADLESADGPAAGHGVHDSACDPPAGIDIADRHAFVFVGWQDAIRDVFTRTGGGQGRAAVVVFEPDLAVLNDAMWRADWSDMLSSRRCLVLTTADPAAFGSRVAPLASLFGLPGGVSIVTRRGVDPAFAGEVGRTVRTFVHARQTHVATAVTHGRKTCENLTRNLQRYVASAGIDDFKGAAAGRPAVVVSAGPSLRKNIADLRDAGGRVVIIAVQTALRPLLEAGVVPHFVCALDHHRISTRFYEYLPPDLPTTLVAEPKVAPEVLDVWGDRPIALLGNDWCDRVLGLPPGVPPKARLPAGATVAHLAFSFAGHLGCADVLLVGQDLGFSDGLAYVPGTGYDDVWRPETGRFCTFEMRQWEHIARDRAALRRVRDVHGHWTYTEQRLCTYLEQFERMFAEFPGRVIDATQGGVAKRGTVVMPLAAALQEVDPDKSGGPALLPSVPAAPTRAAAVAPALLRRATEADRIADVCRKTLPLLNAVARHAGDARRVNPLVAQIDVLRRPLAELDETYGLLLPLNQQAQLDRFYADVAIASHPTADPRSVGDRQRSQVERDRINVQGILDAAEAMASMFRRLAV